MKIVHHIRHRLRHIRSGEYVRILTMRTIGNFLIFSSLFLIGKTFYQPVKEEVRYFIDKQTQKEYVVTDQQTLAKLGPEKTKGLLAKSLNLQNVDLLIPQDPNFSIVIPKIGANARIIPNVDVSDEPAYLEALQKGVAHAKGTAFPGENSHIFLFAHSTDYIWNVGTYNAVFYLLSKLEKSDEVNIFYKNNRYVYKVIDKKIVDPSQVEYLTRKTNREFLTLQTCWPPGTTLKRMLVFATRVAE